MNEIFLAVAGEEIPNLQLVSRRWMSLISARRSRYARNSITDLTISFNNGIRYITQAARRQSVELPACSRRWCSHDLASAVPHISIDCLELRIHNINEQFDDLQLSTIDTRSIDIKFCRPIGSTSSEHIVGLLSELLQNRSIEAVRLSSEVAQPSTALISDIAELFHSNRIQLILDL